MSYKAIFSFIFLPMIAFIGIITSRQDAKEAKIRNRWIVTGILYACGIYLLAGLFYWQAVTESISPFFRQVASHLVWDFDKWCVNLIVSTVVAYALWHRKLWAPGDAKLFICYAALIPINQYHKTYFNHYFASFWLLLTTFMPATFFIIAKSLFYFFSNLKLKNIQDKLNLKIENKYILKWGRVFFGFLVFFLFFRLLNQEFSGIFKKILPNQSLLMIISLLAFRQLSNFFRKHTKLMLIIFIVLLLNIIFKTKMISPQIIVEMFKMSAKSFLIMLLFPIISKVTDQYLSRTISQYTPFAHWMFLGALLAWFL